MLALHESSVVGMATGWAIARNEPALAILHTTAGLGNAVGALATARVNRAPLVVLVGQQDRRHLALEPFLSGKLLGLAGEYPVWVDQPLQAQDVPGAVDRAYHEATTWRGPALVIVPMDDWAAAAEETREDAAAAHVVRAESADPKAVSALAELAHGRPRTGAGGRSRCGRCRDVGGAGLARGAHSGARSGRSPSAPARASRRITPTSQATCPPTAPGCGGHSHPTTSCSRSARPSSASIRTSPASWWRAEHGSPCQPGPGRGASEPGGAGGARRPRSRLRRACPHGSAADAAPTPEPFVATGTAAAPWLTASRCGRGTSSPHSRNGCRATRSDRGDAVQPPGAARAPSRAGAARVPQRGDGRARLRVARQRSASAWRRPDRPVVAVVGDGSSLYGIQSLWSAGHYRVRRVVRDPLQRRLRRHGPARRADRRHARRGPGSASTSPGWHARSAVPLAASPSTATSRPRSTTSSEGSRTRDEPLLLAVEVAPDRSFAP